MTWNLVFYNDLNSIILRSVQHICHFLYFFLCVVNLKELGFIPMVSLTNIGEKLWISITFGIDFSLLIKNTHGKMVIFHPLHMVHGISKIFLIDSFYFVHEKQGAYE